VGSQAHFESELSFKEGRKQERKKEEVENDQFPSLAKEGWTRHQIKCREASFVGADGVVGSTTDYSVA
jgi:hypothetical protein